MANRLASESSPYLLQHAANPVEWFPWGEEAIAAAGELGSTEARLLRIESARLRADRRVDLALAAGLAAGRGDLRGLGDRWNRLPIGGRR